MPLALLFPGQGSQTPSMRDDVAEHAPDLLDRVTDLVGEDPFARAGDSTRFAQPAIFCASVAGWRQAQGEPIAVAGHSLGELAALVAAGAIHAQEALELVVLRGALMAEHAGDGTMLALLGATDEQAEQLAADHGVVVANHNAPGQIVLAGARDALEGLAGTARDGGLRALELGISGAFHSPDMEPAVEPFRAALKKARWREPVCTVVSCATARPFEDPANELADALVRPVRWTETMRALAALGADEFVDVGPGRVLHKLVGRIMKAEPARA